jgi:hypothetical protein
MVIGSVLSVKIADQCGRNVSGVMKGRLEAGL